MSKRKLILANNPLLSGPALDERNRPAIPYREIPIGAIERDANQPRVTFDEERLKELAESIRTYGILSPILVRPGKLPNKYQLISGERRLRAAKIVGLPTVPVIVNSDADETGERTLAIQLVENLQRSDLMPLERAHAINALKETYSLSVREVAERLGISKSNVQRSLEILELPDDLLNALRQGASESKVLLLAKIQDPDIRASYLKDLDTLTRTKLQRELEEKEKPMGAQMSPEDRRIADEIQRAIGVKVKLLRNSPASEMGRLVLDFYSQGDLQEIFRKLVSA